MLSLVIDLSSAGETVELVLLYAVATLVIIDIYLYMDHIPGNTLSNIIHNWVYTRNHFVISYLWGVLGGHFFLGVEDPLITSSMDSLVIVLSIGLILFLLGLFTKPKKGNITMEVKKRPYLQAIMLLLGTVVGHFFWSLKFSTHL